MFSELMEKIGSFEEHHQALFAFAGIFGIVCFSWGIERLLERFIIPKYRVVSSLISIFLGLGILWLTRHFALNIL